MTGIYRGILERIEQDPGIVLERRISLPVWEKAWVAVRSLAGNGIVTAPRLNGAVR
jgi:phytoene synthase